jgi:agmatine deiminase
LKTAAARLPAELGLRMPGEWEKHEATWIAWPHEKADWPAKFAPVPWVFAEVVRHLVGGERVRILVGDERLEKQARRILQRVGVELHQVDFVRAPTDRVWTRDSNPLWLVGQATRGLACFRFNGWAKYPNHLRDAALPRIIARRTKLQWWRPGKMVLEGGSVDVNGQGTLLTTEECLLSEVQARNPGFSREDYQRVFAEVLGARHVIWLGEGIVGDDTHGHVDDLARFVGPRTVALAVEDDPLDGNHARLQDNLKRLQKATDQDGKPLTVVKLPMPAPLFLDGQRLPASYANFYVGNAAVLVPTFNDPNDRKALDILAQLFPSRSVVGIHAVDLVWGLGTIHCLTQQEPAAA